MTFKKNQLRRSVGTAVLAASLLFGSAVIVSTLAAPAAFAQGKGKQVKMDKAVGVPLQAAVVAAQAGDFKTASAQADLASAAAKAPADVYQVNNVKRAVYSNTREFGKLAAVLESMIASGLMPAGEVQQAKRSLIKAYDASGQNAKALAAARDFVTAYGHDKEFTGYVASKAYQSGDFKTAIDWANRAIDGERKAGRGAPEALYKIILQSYFKQKDMKSYFNYLEKLALAYPKDEYWRQLVSRADSEAKFSIATFELDKFRLLQAAGVGLTNGEKLNMAEAAFSRKLAPEALVLLEALKTSGELTKDPAKAARNQKLYDTAKKDAAADKASLTVGAIEAAKKPTGAALLNFAELYLVTGDNAKAVELYKAGIAKGGLQPLQSSSAALRLGIAQFRAGQKSEAKATWAAITGDDGAAALARTWSVVASK